MQDAVWTMPAERALEAMGSTRGGLSAAEAAARLAREGPNALAREGGPSPLALLARQLKSPLALILLFGAAISMVLKEWLDAAIIFAIVGGSAALGFTQEFRASRAVEALRARLALKAMVLRDGKATALPVSQIVRGDVVRLTAGNLVPADGLILEASDCLVSQAALTGESLPVEKAPGVAAPGAAAGARDNMLFAGSSLRSGMASLLITATGSRTELGMIAREVGGADEVTAFERGVHRFGALLVRVMIVIVLAVLTVNQLLGRPLVESLLFAVALAVGLSPELLPAIISVTLAAGARRLAAGGVIVRRLDAIENLGGMDVLCTDKTGTLTLGEVRLESAIDGRGAPSDAVMAAAFINAALESGIANPLDQAIVAAGEAKGLSAGAYRKRDEIPYDFNRRRLSILADGDDGAGGSPGAGRMITKGAFAEVLAVCDHYREDGIDLQLDAPARRRFEALFQEKGEAGYRVLAVSERAIGAARVSRADEAGMTLTGLLLFLDPPKPQAAKTIADLVALGISPKVISGDNRHVTAHVAAQVGIDVTRMLTGPDLMAMSDEALKQRAPGTTIFAEIDPQQKERIIRALQSGGATVGYMGDGINDAPALRLADVGISVDTAVDVARESADLVLLDRDLDVLRRGVEAGRRTFANTLKYICITTSANFGNMVSMALATPVLPFLPLLAKQILLNNFLSDIPSLSISSDNVDPEAVAAPQHWDIAQVQRFMIVFGLISSVFDLITFAALRFVFHADAATFQTVWFVISLLTELAVVMVLRTRRLAIRSRPSGLLIWTTVAMAAAALVLPYFPAARTLFAFETPGGAEIGFCIAVVLLYVAATEAAKRVFYGAEKRRGREAVGT
ncbi:MAG: magnesium-translocating P-type ATPase [Caulobacteraceae bacterium]